MNPNPIPKTNLVSHHGGPCFGAKPVKIWLIWWGSDWNSGSPLTHKTDMETDINNLQSTEYYNTLWQYETKKPVYAGSVSLTSHPIPGQTQLTFTEITDAIRAAQTSGLIPNSNNFVGSNSTYPGFSWIDLDNFFFLFIPPGKQMPTGFWGAHSAVDNGSSWSVWGALPYWTTPGTGVYAGFTAQEMNMQAWTHEAMDALSDPYPNLGWVETSTKLEICQMQRCGHRVERISTIAVESYWSDMDGKCIIPGIDSYVAEPISS